MEYIVYVDKKKRIIIAVITILATLFSIGMVVSEKNEVCKLCKY